MDLTRVVNIRREECDVYIGRPSKWGNPYVVGRAGSREEVIVRYENYILYCRSLLDDLPELEGKRLGCHCSPLPCHGDVLVRLVEARRVGTYPFMEDTEL